LGVSFVQLNRHQTNSLFCPALFDLSTAAIHSGWPLRIFAFVVARVISDNADRAGLAKGVLVRVLAIWGRLATLHVVV
jgi:hypothetical protein